MQNKSNKPARTIAFCGVCCALALVFMLLGNLPLAAYCAPILASVVLIPILIEQGEKFAWLSYAVISLLGLMLCAEKEASFLFLFLGYYPILKFRHMEFIRSRALRIALRLILFNAAILLMSLAMLLLMGGAALAAQVAEDGLLLTILFLLMGNAAMLIYDVMLERLMMLYLARRNRRRR